VGAALGPALPLAANLQVFLPRNLRAPRPFTGAASYTMLRSELLLCPAEPRTGALSIQGCAGLAGGVLVVQPDEFVVRQSATRPLLSTILQVNARIWVSRALAMRLGGTFGIALLQPKFDSRRADGTIDEMFAVSAVTLTLHAGMSFGL